MSEGWIKVYRKFQDHWLNESKRPRTRREAWEDMLMTVNYKTTDVMIRGTIYKCERGQSMLSIDNWAERFKWSRMQVRNFFKLLEKDKMITTRNIYRTTLLTICNYEAYQGDNPDDEPAETSESNQQTIQQTAYQKTTIKEVKKERIINNTNPACAREENSSLQKDDFGGGITFEEFEADFLNNFSMKADLMRKHGMNEETYDKILDCWLIDRKVAEDWNFKSLNGNLLKRTPSDLRAYFTNYLKIEYEKIKAKNNGNGRTNRVTTFDDAVERMLG